MSGSRDLVATGTGGTAVANYGDYAPLSVDRMDLSESVSFFRRQFKLIAIITALALAAGALISILAGKTYLAESTVMLTNDAAIVTQSTAATTPQPALSSEVVDTQMQIISSQEMAQRVAQSLGLTNGLDGAGQRKGTS